MSNAPFILNVKAVLLQENAISYYIYYKLSATAPNPQCI